MSKKTDQKKHEDYCNGTLKNYNSMTKGSIHHDPIIIRALDFYKRFGVYEEFQDIEHLDREYWSDNQVCDVVNRLVDAVNEMGRKE